VKNLIRFISIFSILLIANCKIGICFDTASYDENGCSIIYLRNGEIIAGVITDIQQDTIKISVAAIQQDTKDTVYLRYPTKEILYNDVLYIKGKSPKVASNIASTTGFFIHGWGHKYCGDEYTFVILSVLEVTALIDLASSIIPLVGPGIFPREGVWIRFPILFLGSWIYDIIDAPKAAERYNKNIKEHGFHLKLSFDKDTIKMQFAQIKF